MTVDVVTRSSKARSEPRGSFRNPRHQDGSDDDGDDRAEDADADADADDNADGLLGFDGRCRRRRVGGRVAIAVRYKQQLQQQPPPPPQRQTGTGRDGAALAETDPSTVFFFFFFLLLSEETSDVVWLCHWRTRIVSIILSSSSSLEPRICFCFFSSDVPPSVCLDSGPYGSIDRAASFFSLFKISSISCVFFFNFR